MSSSSTATQANADASGNDLLVLDADIDENGRLLALLADLFKHKFNGGSHPSDIHAYLALDNPL